MTNLTRGGGTSTEIERAEPPGAVDLVVTGLPLTCFAASSIIRSRGPNRMSAADQSTTVDRHSATDLDVSGFDGLPGFPGAVSRCGRWPGTGWGEAVVHFEPVDGIEIQPARPNASPDCRPNMRQHIGVGLIAIEFLLQSQADGAMPQPSMRPIGRTPGCSRRNSSPTSTTPAAPSVI